MLENYRFIGAIRLMFPRSTILHTLRDPADTCFAAYRMDFILNLTNWFTADLADMGRHYVRYRRLMDHWARVLPGRVVDVVYEDLVADFPAQVLRWCRPAA